MNKSFLILCGYTTLPQIRTSCNELKGKSIFLCLLSAMWFTCLCKLRFRAEALGLNGVGRAGLSRGPKTTRTLSACCLVTTRQDSLTRQCQHECLRLIMSKCPSLSLLLSCRLFSQFFGFSEEESNL